MIIKAIIKMIGYWLIAFVVVITVGIINTSLTPAMPETEIASVERITEALKHMFYMMPSIFVGMITISVFFVKSVQCLFDAIKRYRLNQTATC